MCIFVFVFADVDVDEQRSPPPSPSLQHLLDQEVSLYLYHHRYYHLFVVK